MSDQFDTPIAERTADETLRQRLSMRTKIILDHTNSVAAQRDHRIEQNRFYYEDDWRYMRFLVPEGLRVLELGCGTGQLLARLKPAIGVGVDFSSEMIAIARRNNPQHTFIVADVEDGNLVSKLVGPFDFIVISDTMGSFQDCITTIENLLPLCTRDTRLIVAYYSHLWEPILKVGEWLGAKTTEPELNWLSSHGIVSILELSGFEVIKREWRQLLPKKWFGLGTLVSRYIATLPGIRRLALRNYVVAQPSRERRLGTPSASVVIPCRNEKGNIEPAIRRLPRFCDDLEILFVEGNSDDGTFAEVLRVQAAYPDLNIKALQQKGTGKGDAVHLGFEKARGDILIILDADLTVAPEDLPKFYAAITSGKGDFINGTRFVYPMETGAMRLLNNWSNRAFARIFSYLLNQRLTDTLCGTKVLSRTNYRKIIANRDYFGDFDPFGDFDLIFGAVKLHLKIVEIPVSYANRRYGTTQISRFSDGWLLLRMVLFAYRKLKAL
ncbi:MAG: glycosyltransferase [Rhodospirillales bacterium]|jgi:SAM-dependent methyltransferase|nr:glycosyltransferase [Rhodospirillales bacterium]